MRAIVIRDYQQAAVRAITDAVSREQKEIIVEMATGTGMNIVLASTVECLQKEKNNKILIVTDSINVAEQISALFLHNYREIFDTYSDLIDIETAKRISEHSKDADNCYKYIITYNVPEHNTVYKSLHESFNFDVLISFQNKSSNGHTENVVFEYTVQDAVKDAIIIPAVDPRLYDIAIEGFCKRLLEKYNCRLLSKDSNKENKAWDNVFINSDKKIWVQYKNYKNQFISPSAVNAVLKNIIRIKAQSRMTEGDIVLLILFGNASKIDRTLLYSKYNIIVWDIPNLIYYIKGDTSLLNELSQLVYFPIENISGEASEGWTFTTVSYNNNEKQNFDRSLDLIHRLKNCGAGREYYREYEEICEEVIQYLFGESFHSMSSQHKSEDEHFRMDMICSFKGINANTPVFWQLLAHYYNTHFVVFEFKNYEEKIDQNLIYITEKYLFNPALRNVAIIISRKGFSKAAEFAAGGCLKENGKLILDITDDDLIKMLKEKKQGECADTLLLDKYEQFVMSISK